MWLRGRAPDGSDCRHHGAVKRSLQDHEMAQAASRRRLRPCGPRFIDAPVRVTFAVDRAALGPVGFPSMSVFSPMLYNTSSFAWINRQSLGSHKNKAVSEMGERRI